MNRLLMVWLRHERAAVSNRICVPDRFSFDQPANRRCQVGAKICCRKSCESQPLGCHQLAREYLHKLRRQLSLFADSPWSRSEEHTSELQSLMRISYAVFCLTKKKTTINTTTYTTII